MASLSSTLKMGFRSKFNSKIDLQFSRSLIATSVLCKSSENGRKSTTNAVPRNVEEMKASVKAKFSPHRTRDSSSARIDVKMAQPSGMFGGEFMNSQGARQDVKINVKSKPIDSHVAVYDANNSVSLSSVMQSNVPQPFSVRGEHEVPAHLNMPGGQWAQGDKYISGDLHDHHHTRNNPKKSQGMTDSARLLTQYLTVSNTSQIYRYPLRPNTNLPLRKLCIARDLNARHLHYGSCFKSLSLASHYPFMNGRFEQSSAILQSLQWIQTKGALLVHTSPEKTESPPSGSEEALKLSQRQRLKRAVKEYGATVIVFHVTISLASLGIFYLLVSSGVDMSGLIDKLGINLAKLEEAATTTINETELLSEDSKLQPSNITVLSEVEGGRKVRAVAAGVSTFVLAYAIHKVFAPVRIAITLTATPFIVRHLRKIGFLKAPKNI